MKKLITLLLIGLVSLLGANSCLDLDEELYSSITTANFFQTEKDCLLAMGNAYAAKRRTASIFGAIPQQVLATDEAVIPLRDAGISLYNNGIFLEVHYHDFNPGSSMMNYGWAINFSTASRCSNIIHQIESSPAIFDKKEAFIAEMKILRAYSYFNALDLYGNIPIVLDVSNRDLPEQLSRSEAFQIIENELLENYMLLDAEPTQLNYGRFTRGGALTVLAKLYLNAEKWIGTQRYVDAIAACDQIINSGHYLLESDFFANFKVDNEGSRENIYAMPYDRTVDSWGFIHHVLCLPQSTMSKFGYTLAWNGMVALPEFYDKFDEADLRRNSFEVGPQYYENGSPIMNLSGEPLVFTNTVSNILMAGEGEGARFFKYEYPRGLRGTESMDNDWVVYRYADILLIKAEAIMRQNGGVANQEAVNLVNQVRERAFGNSDHNYTTETLTLSEILDERGRELAWEGHRRQDLVRFGRFGDAWYEKEAWTSNHKELYPIPTQHLVANPNLQQNPGY